ncbi:hypothetical protein [Acinetobacter indicus]|uniref:hypothetical protein n=1 Tax=Acinetobacter indicus TaxID=756892 RepID=UPI003988E58D
MIKTPLSTMIGGAFWTPGATVIGGTSKTFDQLIKSLFENGEQGFVYDPNDLSAMFQDAAGTVPVTAAGQPVGLILDKSGRNNHARQTNSASRPILRKNAITGAYYLEFDGSDDFLQTNSVDFTATDKVSLFVGVRKLSDITSGAVAELSASTASNNGSFGLFAPDISSWQDVTSFLKGDGTRSSLVARNYAAPISVLVTAKFDISANDKQYLKVNSAVHTSALSVGSGFFGNYPLYIGRREGTQYPLNGHIYGLIGVGRLVTDNETASIEKELAKRLGVTLSV